MSLKSIFTTLLVFLFCSVSPVFAQIQGPAETTAAVQHDVSEDLRNVRPLPPRSDKREIPVYHLPRSLAADSPDPVVQTQAGTTIATVSGLNFDGVGNGFTGPNGAFSPDAAPPDTNGAVGTTQFVQWVNESFAVFDKVTGAVLYGPAAGNTLWSGFGGKCQSNNDGDIIAQFDKAASRWVLTQFAVSGGGGYLQCVAISQTADATGAWYRYAFPYAQFPDYPKVGIWPDAYYVTFNMFQGNSFKGPKACAWDRTRMLAGLSATQVCFQLGRTVGSLLPSDLDGTTPPPAGAPNYLLTMATNSLQLYRFHVDFATTSNSALTGPTNIPVAAFSEACGGGTCIPQPGTQQLLDSLADRLMYRLAYRNFGDHEALVVNHSIATANSIGVRWYELRNPGGTPVLYQQGTYAPDSDYRWMGSIAMDHVGNIALGYSISSSSRYPSIRYTVRASGDPLGQMGAENQIVGGNGSQLQSLARWGDYSSMSVDPVDDCTFWYTNEYLKTSGTFNWSTRIASFKMDNCGSSTAVAVNVQTNPAGLQISVDGTTYTAPQSFNWVSGSSHTIATITPQGSSGTRYTFANWSDSGAISHSVSPTTATTYIANFSTQYLLTTSISPAGGGTISRNPSSGDGYYDSGTSVQLTAAANSGYTFGSWSGDATGSTNPTSVVMSAPRSVTANFNPVTGTIAINVQSSPAGLQITVDGTTYTAPQSFNWVSGSSHTIATSTPQGSGGTRYVFASWSDGGAVSHTVAPTVATTYTANFTTQYLLTTNASPGGSGSISANPSSGNGYYNSGTSVQLTAAANSGYTFANWSGDASGSTNPTSVVMSAPRNVTANFSLTGGGSSGLRFVPVTPCRVADTRNATGPFGGPIMSGNTTRSFAIPDSACGIPSTAQAYSLNVTVVPSGSLGYLSIWPTGQPQPLVSTLNSFDGRVKESAALVPAGSAGAVSVYVSDTTHVILDINGYFAQPTDAPSGLVLYPVTPCRVMDTRLADGPFGGPILSGGSSRTVPILSSSCGLPAGAAAYLFNITVVPSGPLDSVTLYATGTTPPQVSNLADPLGAVVSNAAFVRAGTSGSVDVYVSQQTHLIIDVNGYFAAPAAGGLLFNPTTPCRVVDTRNPTGPFGGPALSGSRDFNVPAGPCPVSATAKAYSLNATVVPHGVLGYLSLWPTGQSQPLVSTLNSFDGTVVSNAAVIGTDTGAISAYASDTTDLILDMNGYFAP